MSSLHVALGVAVLNALLLAVGYALLAASLRGLSLRARASYAGIALLVSTGLLGVVLSGLAVTGLRTGPWTAAIVAAVLAGAGLAVRKLGPTVVASRTAGTATALSAAVTTVAATAVVAIVAILLLNGLRSSPRLDDTWAFWLPKGVALDRLGLDGRLFLPGSGRVPFDHLDYPFWWSTIINLDVRAAGSLDLRAVDAQLAILVAAFFAAAWRLLSGHARPWLLWPGLLLLAASPEIRRQAQGGGADLPLAIYLTLFVVCLALWVADGDRLVLGLAAISAAAALQIKTEGLPQLLLFAALAAIFARRARRGIGVATAAAFVSAAPFLVWRQVHGLRNDISIGNALDPSFLAGRTDRIGPSAHALAAQLLQPEHWLLVVPLALVLSIAGAAWQRRALLLAPAVLLTLGYVFWVWVNWSDTDELQFRLTTSAYRIVDPLALLAALAVPLLAERLLRPRAAAPRAPGAGA